VGVEPLEFTSSGGRGEALSRQVKSRFLTFYEGIKVDSYLKSLFSHKGTKNAKIISFNINKLTL